MVTSARRPSVSKEGSAHRRVPSLDAALRRLRLSEDTYYSASASASADQEVPPSAPPLPAAERPASRFALDPATSNGGISDDGTTNASPPEGDEEEEEESNPGDGVAELDGEQAGSPPHGGLTLDLAARGDTARQSQKGDEDAHDADEDSDAEGDVGGAVSGRHVLVTEEEEPIEEQASVWHSYSAAELSLPTQALLVDWLLDAPDVCR